MCWHVPVGLYMYGMCKLCPPPSPGGWPVWPYGCGTLLKGIGFGFLTNLPRAMRGATGNMPSNAHRAPDSKRVRRGRPERAPGYPSLNLTRNRL